MRRQAAAPVPSTALLGDRGPRSEVTVCGICPAGCAVRAHVAGGRLEGVTALPHHPRGHLCPRGARAPEIVHSPDRLHHPLGREGPRGEGRLGPIEWDEAYARVVDGLRSVADRYGPEAACIYTGRGNFDYGLNETFAPSGTVESSANAVLFPFGSPNATGVGSLCYAAYGMLAPRAVFGEPMRRVHADLEGADLVLLWGANPAVSSPPKMARLRRAARRGARFVVIDHRRTETCRALDAEWVGIRPGTDGALALGAIHVLLSERLHDHDFADRWTHGLEELRGYVARFDPSTVASITGVPSERVRQLARQVARTARTALVTYTGLEYSSCGVQALRALWCFQALAGHLDTPGGNLLVGQADPVGLQRCLTPPPTGAKPPIGAAEHPLYCEARKEAHAALLPRAILEGKPYPVRALIVSGSSLQTAWPDPALWRRALSALELLVVVDRFPTADGLYADVVLPASTGFESESYVASYVGGGTHVQLRRKVIDPIGESRSDYRIFAGLAAALGYGHLWPPTEEAMIQRALAGSRVDLSTLREHPEGVTMPDLPPTHRKHETGGLRADGRPGFQTPTGKLELASIWLSDAGYASLPEYVEPTEGPRTRPGLAGSLPLVLTTGARTRRSFRSQDHNIPSLAAREPAPEAQLHPIDADARGIADGDEVAVVTARGRVLFVARVTEDILPGVVEANMGGGGPLGPEPWRRSNVNDLTDLDNRDPISGFPAYKALLCEVLRADGKDLPDLDGVVAA